MNKYEVIEMLECALINCNNIKKVGSVMIDMVALQIQSAIDLINEEEDNEIEEETEDDYDWLDYEDDDYDYDNLYSDDED